jgi:hypothetical protein
VRKRHRGDKGAKSHQTIIPERCKMVKYGEVALNEERRTKVCCTLLEADGSCLNRMPPRPIAEHLHQGHGEPGDLQRCPGPWL